MKKPLYWIGIRGSELQDTQALFDGAITIFGSANADKLQSFEGEHSLRYDYNQDSAAWVDFVSQSAKKILKQTPDAQFMLYSPDEAQYYSSDVINHAVCQNPQSILELLENKFLTRQWLSEYVPILPYKIQKGKTLSFSDMQDDFPGAESFVVQAASSCGGSGTWLVTKENYAQALQQLVPELQYAVSAYQKNSVSPNVHLVIYAKEVLILPPSVQIVGKENDRLVYKGADFPLYRKLLPQFDTALKQYAKKVGDVLRRAGYRGVCGVDFLIANNKIYLMEVNPRFQSSTFILNRAIREAGYQSSVQAMQLDSFLNPLPPDQFRPLSELEVIYSSYHYEYQPKRMQDLHYAWELLKSAPNVECIDDDLDWTIHLEPQTYLFKGLFRGSIAAITPYFQFRIHGNIGLSPKNNSTIALHSNLELLKIMLLGHGARLSEAAMERLAATGGFNHEEFWALDIVLCDYIYICVPYNTNRSELSPFCVEVDNKGQYFLSYYGECILNVKIRSEDALGNKQTGRGIPYHDITYLGNDRLRVFHRAGCFFKHCGTGCKFCDVPNDERIFTISDIFQATDAYCDHPAVRHYLIGGGSAAPDDDFSTIALIAEHIRETTGKPIYLMSLPPQHPQILAGLKQAGIGEVAFNLEVFDRELAQNYMPGKGAIPLTTYENAFRTATELWGKTGNVRTIFVVGLESTQSLLQGISWAAQMGVSPILSLFRPIEDTPLQDFLAPSDREVWEICQRAKEICAQHGLELGPACSCCEDNTLKISL